jgi:hypothetical protein
MSRLKEAIALVQRLYELHDAGGPLHVQLDDGNLDMDMEPMYAIPAGGFRLARPDNWSIEVHEVCDRICELMTPMTEYHRRLVRRHALSQHDDRRELAERFANQQQTHAAAIEELANLL